MYVYWHNGALRLDPETPGEADALDLLARSAKFDRRSEEKVRHGAWPPVPTATALPQGESLNSAASSYSTASDSTHSGAGSSLPILGTSR